MGQDDATYPPATARMISMLSPSAMNSPVNLEPGTTLSFRATAIPEGGAPKSSSSAATLVRSGNSRVSPLITARIGAIFRYRFIASGFCVRIKKASSKSFLLPSMRSAVKTPVIGANRIPLRKCPVAR